MSITKSIIIIKNCLNILYLIHLIYLKKCNCLNRDLIIINFLKIS